MTSYEEFLAKKPRRFVSAGFACDRHRLPGALFDWQDFIVMKECGRGRSALWADTGLGKTIMQLTWADQVAAKSSKPTLVLTPLAVSAQTVREAKRFGISAEIYGGTSADVIVCNYQKLHLLNPSDYGGVVLDESSILKSFTGSTKQALTAAFAGMPYRLACTATPAPNDYIELGNHSEFLGVMPMKEMLARWFVNDLMGNMSWRLKGHARGDFWRWVASWATVMRTPADIGYPADGYALPALRIHHVSIPADGVRVEGRLFADASLSATTLHTVLRQTAPMRAKKAAELIEDDPDSSWLLWTHTNYEADDVRSVLNVEEVRGSDSDARKESILLGFSDGSIPRLLTKPSLAGFGMNWQHCHKMIFVGMDYSYEKFYQAVRRCWRYGQQHPVDVYVLSTDVEWRLFDALAKKQAAHLSMQEDMLQYMKESHDELAYAG